MGLFSFLNKNKQETTGDDGGYVSRDEDDTARARAKRASSAGEPAARRGRGAREAAADPVLPEKKRARRRLVGAIALALAVAVGLPMILDAEEKPRADEIDIRIPSKEKAAALPLPAAEPAPAPAPAAAPLVDAPKPAEAPPPALVTVPREVATVKAAPVKSEEKVLPKPDVKAAVKPPVKVEKDAERALAILEGKAAPAPAAQKYSMQVAALSSQDKVNELMAKLKAEGIPATSHKGPSANGELIRVKVGPFTREEGEKIRPKLDKLGLSGKAVAN